MHSQLVYANLTTHQPNASLSGDTHSFPPFLVGKQYPLAFRWSERVGRDLVETFKTIRALRATVSFDDLRPTSGTTRLQVGPGASTEANTTPALQWNTDAGAIALKLNALSGFAGANFKVASDRGTYLIRRENGAKVEIEPVENNLIPVSFARVGYKQDDIGWVTELRFTQSPVAFTDTSTPILPPKPYFEPVVDGVDYGNGITQNEVQNLVRPATFRGQFYIEYRADEEEETVPVRTPLFSRADGPAQYQAALNAILAPAGGSVTVTNPDQGKARFEFGGALKGVNLPLLNVVVPVEGTPPGDTTIVLNFNQWETWSAVRGLKPGETIKVPFELEIDIPTVEGDDESPSQTLPVWLIDIELKRPLTLEGMATAQPIGWLIKPNPKKYLPYNQTQIGFGQYMYEAVIGDGVETVFDVNHNRGVAAISGLKLMELDTGRILQDSEYTKISSNEGNTLTITFPEPPAANNIHVTLATPQPIEFFINDLVIEMSQVNGLPEALANIGERLLVLEAVLPTTGPAATPATGLGTTIVLKKIRELMHYKGDKTLDELLDEKTGLKEAPDDQDRPYLLPAIHDASLDALPDPLPSVVGNAGKVYTAAADVRISPGSGINAAIVKTGEHAGCDGRSLYKVERDAATNSYYPAAFARRAVLIAVDEKMLLVGQTFDFQWGIQTQTLDADCVPQFGVYAEIGAIEAASSPSPVGQNISAVTWAAAPVFQYAIRLDPNLQTHSFGVRIKRNLASLALDQRIGAQWSGNNDAAPETANFVLRVRFNFDIEDAPLLPRGWVYWGLTGALDSDGKPAELRATLG